jgi:hypothetical protein
MVSEQIHSLQILEKGWGALHHYGDVIDGIRWIRCRFWRRVGELFTTISMIDGIRENFEESFTC